MTSDLALDLAHVAKTYRGKVHALRGIEMRVHRGEVFGLLGPNGAGKSTLIKILMTVIRASRCEGTMLGERVGHRATLQRVGYLPEHHKFPPYLKGRQLLEFFAAMSNVDRATRRRRSAELLDVVGMSDWGEKKVGGYSKGMRQRLGIAQSLMADPDLVLLDEPTDGVDPVGRRDIRGIVQRLKDEGRTVFLNSHLLSELEMVCDRVAILVQGKVRMQGTLEELTEGQRRYELEIEMPADGRAAELLERSLTGQLVQRAMLQLPPAATPTDVDQAKRVAITGELASGERVQIERTRLMIATTDPGVMGPIIDRLRAASVTIVSLEPRKPSLEDLFIAAVTDSEGRTLKPGAARQSEQDGGTP